MSAPYIGEIRMFGGNFAPVGWALCNGQTIAISENDTLFNLIGTTYGGDGQNTFALPNLQGRIPIHQGTYLGNTFTIGEMSGAESVTLTLTQLPLHTHLPQANSADGSSDDPTNNFWAAQPALLQFSAPGTANSAMKTNLLGVAGSNQPHNNMQPFLAVNYIISLYGVYPSQN